MIDFIYTIPVKSINIKEVRGIGIELGSDNCLKQVQILIYLMAILKMENIDSNVPLLYRPSHRFTLTLLQELSFLTFQLSSKYTSRQLYEDFLSNDHPIVENKSSFSINGATRNYNYRIKYLKKDLRIFDLAVKVKKYY